jgi:hypothetical protein
MLQCSTQKEYTQEEGGVLYYICLSAFGCLALLRVSLLAMVLVVRQHTKQASKQAANSSKSSSQQHTTKLMMSGHAMAAARYYADVRAPVPHAAA